MIDNNLSKLSEEEIKKLISDYHQILTKCHQELDNRKAPKPVINKENIPNNFHPIYDACVELVKSADAGRGKDQDLERYMFEHCMEGVYGPSIWDWLNPKM